MVDRAAAGKTVFLSSHQIAEVERVADVVAILRNGKLMLVERLDELKAQTREVTLTMEDGAPGPPELPGEILSSRRKSRQWQLLLRGVAEDRLESLGRHESVRQVEIRSPNLEEIFVAYMELGASSGGKSVVEEVPTQ